MEELSESELRELKAICADRQGTMVLLSEIPLQVAAQERDLIRRYGERMGQAISYREFLSEVGALFLSLYGPEAGIAINHLQVIVAGVNEELGGKDGIR